MLRGMGRRPATQPTHAELDILRVLWARVGRLTCHRCGKAVSQQSSEQIVHEIQQEFAGKVVWGEDLMELTFAGPTIANIEGY